MESEIMSFFFQEMHPNINLNSNLCNEFLDLIDQLNVNLEKLQLPNSVQCIYNPTIYARNTFEQYVRKYCNTKKKVMFFGMNPGPWGMSQTGVPFGEVASVRDWLHIIGPVGKPPTELSNRQVNGFNCKRPEISGKRFWGLFKKICRNPENFFHSSFVYNYLPQQWMKNSGANVTPGEFSASDMRPLYAICDPIFVKVLEIYEVETIIAVGKFCEKRAQKAIKQYLPNATIQIFYLPHPSPRSVNNTNWEEKAENCLKNFNIIQYYI
ncbi:single-strand selective monofunctional uracil DNA glycosylase-like isoform X1 [Achroia grisella]|uniref:single-strand selective monofunctional uracil DNA glycosylase-like isoform X1 n=1 Tax=Achroia grisella TaxID=688607 RepID=UPI0027D22C80|nr:single-strand selective monofunctional uracil DNA glycosylase-like isoform X1 [Achroia grisella]